MACQQFIIDTTYELTCIVCKSLTLKRRAAARTWRAITRLLSLWEQWRTSAISPDHGVAVRYADDFSNRTDHSLRFRLRSSSHVCPLVLIQFVASSSELASNISSDDEYSGVAHTDQIEPCGAFLTLSFGSSAILTICALSTRITMARRLNKASQMAHHRTAEAGIRVNSDRYERPNSPKLKDEMLRCNVPFLW